MKLKLKLKLNKYINKIFLTSFWFVLLNVNQSLCQKNIQEIQIRYVDIYEMYIAHVTPERFICMTEANNKTITDTILCQKMINAESLM